jgi:hypothetical protein
MIAATICFAYVAHPFEWPSSHIPGGLLFQIAKYIGVRTNGSSDRFKEFS